MKKSEAVGVSVVLSLILLMGLVLGSCSNGEGQPADRSGDAAKGAPAAEDVGAETPQPAAEPPPEEAPPPLPPPRPPPPPKEPIVLEGTIEDEKGLAVEQLFPEGYPWTGTFDLAAQRAITITATTRRGDRIVVNPDEDGGFRIEALGRVERLTLRVTGGGLYVVKEGPWRENSSIEFSIDEEELFVIEGVVKVGDAVGIKRVIVSGYDAEDVRMVMGYTDSGHGFRLRSNREVAYLRTEVGATLLREEGPWSSDAVVSLGVDPDEVTTLSITVRDGSGQPVYDATVRAFGIKVKPLGLAQRGAGGVYTVIADEKVVLLKVRRKTGEALRREGPWDSDAAIEISFSSALLFTVKGKVTGKDGRPLRRVNVVPLDEQGKAMPGGITDRAGNYSIECVKKVGSIKAKLKAEATVTGPWESDATVDIGLDE